jgi:type II secretory pathway pseudopilin PulG
MKKNIFNNNSGFSLIETLIAVSILMIAIAGPLSLVQAGLFSSIHQRNQVTATFLAQEAIEYIKNIRDSNSYTNNSGTLTDWLKGPDGSRLVNADNSGTCGSNNNGCYIDPYGKLGAGNTYIQSVSASNLPLRQYSDGNGNFMYYSYGAGGVISPYTRKVTIAPVAGTSDEVTVSVTMGWKDNSTPRTYTVSENIYNYEE